MQLRGTRVIVRVEELKKWGPLYVPEGIGQGMGVVQHAGSECKLVKEGDKILMLQSDLVPWLGKWDFYSRNAGEDMLLWEHDILAKIEGDNLNPVNGWKIYKHISMYDELWLELRKNNIVAPYNHVAYLEVIKDENDTFFLVLSTDGIYVTFKNEEFRFLKPKALLATITGEELEDLK